MHPDNSLALLGGGERLCSAQVIPRLLPGSCGQSKLHFKSPFCVPPGTLCSMVTSLAAPDVLSERQGREAATLPGILAGPTPSHRATSSRSQQQSSPQHSSPRSLCCTPTSQARHPSPPYALLLSPQTNCLRGNQYAFLLSGEIISDRRKMVDA